MTNKYQANCAICGRVVPKNGGSLERGNGKWEVKHLACAYSAAPQVHTVTFSSGHSITRNVNGRCEDAPCCGCCT